MASGTITLNADNYISGELVWSSTPNNSTNASTVSIAINVTTSSSSYLSPWLISVEIYDQDTSTQLAKDALSYTVSYTGVSNKVYTKSLTVTHNGNGTKTLMVKCSCMPQGYLNGAYTPSTGAILTLDTIIRKATLSSAPNFYDTANPQITYNNPMGNNVSALEVCITDSSGYAVYVPYRSVSKTGTSYTFMLTTTERNKLVTAAGNNTSLNIRYYIRTTINGSTYLDYLSRTMTIAVDGPVITASISDTNSTTVALTGGGLRFIPGRNTMTYSMSATGQKGATITKYSVMCGSKSSSSASGTLTNVENSVVIFSATDSRGITSTKTVNLTPVNYVKLTCNQNVRMILQSGSTAQIELKISGNYFKGSFGAKSNTLSLYVRHARNGASMGDWVDLSPLGYTTSGNTYSLTTEMGGFDPSGTYTFQCKAVDALGTVTTSQYAVKFTPVFDWSKSDFNFNVPVTINGDLTVNGTINGAQAAAIDDDPAADYVVDAGTTSMGSNGTWYWRKWNSGRAECYGCRNYGNMSISTAWGGLFRSEAFTQSLPSGLFTATPEVIDITFRNSNFGAWIAKHETSAPSTSSSGSFIMVRPASATLSQAYISFNVIGRWK